MRTVASGAAIRQVVRISRAGSTGITVVLASGDRVAHERIFAQSAASVPRIARVITEHLTEYAQAATRG